MTACWVARTLLALSLALATVIAQGASPPVAEVAFAPPARAVLPLDAPFVDDDGHAIRLRDVIGSRPAVVVPAYYGCSNLCGIVLRGVAASLRASKLQAARDVDVVAVSIDPLDTPATALAKKHDVVGSEHTGWHFLTGTPSSIARFADALGYHYSYDTTERQYAHAAGMVVVAPGGHIVRTLYGASFAPAELRDALHAARTVTPDESATRGEVGTWLLCFHYDPQTGRYSFVAMNAVRVVALAALLCLVGYMVHARRGGTVTRKRTLS